MDPNDVVVRLYDRYDEALWRHVHIKWAKDWNTVDDIVQDVWLDVSEMVRRGEFALKQQSEWGLLRTIADRRAIDHLRKHGRVHWVDGEAAQEWIEPDLGPVDLVLRNTDEVEFRDALTRLTEMEAYIISRRVFDGWSIADIILERGWSQTSTYNAHNSAVERLNELLCK
jgi:RNA polymerase sigma factor (sigma-70 family)